MFAAASPADDSVTAPFWVMELIWFQHKTVMKRQQTSVKHLGGQTVNDCKGFFSRLKLNSVGGTGRKTDFCDFFLQDANQFHPKKCLKMETTAQHEHVS